MSHKEEIGLFFDAANTMEAFIDISEICEMVKDSAGAETSVIELPYSLRPSWRQSIAQRVLEDILVGHPQEEKIQELLITKENFMLTFRNANGTDGNCGRPNTFRRKLDTAIKNNIMFRVAIKLYPEDVTSLGIAPRDTLSTGGRFGVTTTATQSPTPPVTVINPPPAAPNKLEVHDTMALREFNHKTIPALSKPADIQRWYNVLHSRSLICGVYTVPWSAFSKASYMGDTWTLASLDQIVMDRKALMSNALHGLLSGPDMFQGDCKEFAHLITNSQGNGYLALYQIVRLAHPLLGQVTAQPEQPLHRKTQPFSEHISNYLDYFQSEACSGRHYSLNERVILILSRLHPTWRDLLKKKYIQLVPQNGVVPFIPLECHLEMLSVTLTQWCNEEHLEVPTSKIDRAAVPSSPVFRLDDVTTSFRDMQTQDAPSDVMVLGSAQVSTHAVDQAIAHMVLYIDKGASDSKYPKCEACGLPGHTTEKCYPLINYCIAQALSSQHPDIVRKIKAAYKQFPRNARSRTPHKATVKQIVGYLDLPDTADFPSTDADLPYVATDAVTRLDFNDPELFHYQEGSAIVTYHDQPWFTHEAETVAQVFTPAPAPLGPCVLYTDNGPMPPVDIQQDSHSVSFLHSDKDMLVDSGSTITTMAHTSALANYVSPSTSGVKMRSATGQVVQPQGSGTISLQGLTADVAVPCQHTPAIASNILSPAETCDMLDYDLYELTCNRRTHTCQVRFAKNAAPDIVIKGVYSLRMPYIRLPTTLDTVQSILPMTYDFPSITPELMADDNDDAVHQILRLAHSGYRTSSVTPELCRRALFEVFSETLSDDFTHGGLPTAPVMHVSAAVERALWHMRTCHPNPDRLVLLSKISKGMPRLKHPQDIEQCSDCLIAKMRKAARGHSSGFDATAVGQGLALDVGFMFQNSRNKKRTKRLVGINGNNAYCLIYDFFSELIFGLTMRGKSIPLTWLHLLLTRIAPRKTPGRIVRLDLGGETGKNPEIAAMFLKHMYIMEPTGAGASSQNGAGERPHSTIGLALRSMLYSAGLDPSYWEYAFYFFLRVHSILPHGKNTISPYHLVMGFPADLTNLRTFGCLMYAISTKRRDAKLTTENIIRAKLLGYGGSMKTFIYVNIKTKQRGRATHARFDEAQLSTPQDELSPNSRALWGALQRSPGTDSPDTSTILTPPKHFCVFAESSPFLRVRTVIIPVKCTCDQFGLTFETDPMSHRNIITDVVSLSSVSHIAWPELLQFHTVIQVNDIPVFLVSEVHKALAQIDITTDDTFSLIVAPYKPDPTDQQAPLPQVALDQMRVVHHVLHGWDLTDPIMLVTAENADNMAKGTHHTRRTCLKGPDKDKWINAEFDMLDKNDSYGMYGQPIKRHEVPPGCRIARPIWNYSQKHTGEHKARKCLDGKQLVRNGAKFTNTYAACMEQHCLRLFVAIAAYLGNIIEDGDVVNAYAHADAEGPQIYVVADEVFAQWYNSRYGTNISVGDCVPVLKGMQGHPKAGNWWEVYFDDKCAIPMGLIPTFTEPTMYRREDSLTHGPTFAIRQVDDVMAQSADKRDRQAVLEGIGSKVTFKISPTPTKLFYATDIEQTALYIRVHAKSYITSCLLKLGWSTDTSDSKIMVPFPPSTMKEMARSPGPLDPDALLAIVERFGFQYRTMTGLLIFAVQIGRFDIAPSVTILCKYNERPAEVHFQAAKNVMRYLRRTIDRGNIYWRPNGKDRPDLPRGTLTPIRPESTMLSLFPTNFPLMEPICYVDASYAGLLSLGDPRSITGVIICLGGTAIFARTRIQRTTALSATESEIIAGCDAGKLIKYFRRLFGDLGLLLHGPTPVGEDNEGTIKVASHKRSSGRTRHMDIQHFATQEWTKKGLLAFFKIHGTANPSDAMSKVLYRILHSRHFNRIQGYNGSPFRDHETFIPNPNDNPSSG